MKCNIKPYELSAKINLNEANLSDANNIDFINNGINKNSAVNIPGL